MMDAMAATTTQKDNKKKCAFTSLSGTIRSSNDDKPDIIKPVLNIMRNKIASFQLVSSTIQKMNIPGTEKTRVKTKASNNAPGHWFNPVKDKIAPLNNAFSNAVKIQMVKLKNIDLINFI